MEDILKDFCNELCGGHFTDKRTAYKMLQSEYYWPTIFKDAKNYVASCDDCQRMGKPTLENEMSLQAQVVIEPFDKWALYFFGPISPMSKKEKVYFGMYILCNQVCRRERIIIY